MEKAQESQISTGNSLRRIYQEPRFWAPTSCLAEDAQRREEILGSWTDLGEGLRELRFCWGKWCNMDASRAGPTIDRKQSKSFRIGQSGYQKVPCKLQTLAHKVLDFRENQKSCWVRERARNILRGAVSKRIEEVWRPVDLCCRFWGSALGLHKSSHSSSESTIKTAQWPG